MLCDDLVADDKLIHVYDRFDRILARIKAAQKFVLSQEFTVAADGLVENYPELCKIGPWCRVPYPVTWVEWLQDDRPHWNEGSGTARPVDRTRHQFRPHRIGLLMEQKGRASWWKSHLFWSMRAPVPETADAPYNGSLGANYYDAEACVGDDPLIAAVTPGASDFGMATLAGLMEIDPKIVSQLGQYAIEDWGGEIRFMVAMLGLLNTRNVPDLKTVDNTAWNAKRVRRGQRPLFSHTILKIRPSICTAMAGEGKGGHRDLRFHFVRGHLKTRKTGIFWWSAHARGDKQHGTVEKDYEIT